MVLLLLACSHDVHSPPPRSRAKTDIACNEATAEPVVPQLDAGRSLALWPGQVAEFDPIPGATWDVLEAPVEVTELEIDDAEGGFRMTVVEPGVYVVRASRGSQRDKVTVVVEGDGVPPTALAEDVRIDLGQDAELDASPSLDLDGDALSYTWGFNSVPSDSSITKSDLDDSSSATPVFTPDVGGDYELRVTVDDGLYSDVRVVRVQVSEDSSLPDEVSDEDQLVTRGDVVYVGIEADASDTVRFVFVDTPSRSSLSTIESEGNCGWFTPDVVGEYEIKAVRDTGSLKFREYPVITATNAEIDEADLHSEETGWAIGASDDQLILGQPGSGQIVVTDLPLADEPTWTPVLSHATDTLGRAVSSGELADGQVWMSLRNSDVILFHDSSDEQAFTGDVAAFLGDLDGSGGVFLLDDQMYTGPLTGLATLGTLDRTGSTLEMAESAGDQNGDGVADLLVSHETNSWYGSVCTEVESAIQLVHGPITGDHDLRTDYAAKLTRSECGSMTQAKAAVGDLDDDGYGDVAWMASTLAWRPGTSSGVESSGYRYTHDGLYAVHIADHDGDGVQDLVGRGAVGTHVLYGPLSGNGDLLDDADLVVDGHYVEVLADVDDDGAAELLDLQTDGLWLYSSD